MEFVAVLGVQGAGGFEMVESGGVVAMFLGYVGEADVAVGFFNGAAFALGPREACVVAAFGTVEAFDLTANTWSTLTSMPVPRHGMAVLAVGNTVYTIDGSASRFDFPLNPKSCPAPSTGTSSVFAGINFRAASISSIDPNGSRVP